MSFDMRTTATLMTMALFACSGDEFARGAPESDATADAGDEMAAMPEPAAEGASAPLGESGSVDGAVESSDALETEESTAEAQNGDAGKEAGPANVWGCPTDPFGRSEIKPEEGTACSPEAFGLGSIACPTSSPGGWVPWFCNCLSKKSLDERDYRDPANVPNVWTCNDCAGRCAENENCAGGYATSFRCVPNCLQAGCDSPRVCVRCINENDGGVSRWVCELPNGPPTGGC